MFLFCNKKSTVVPAPEAKRATFIWVVLAFLLFFVTINSRSDAEPISAGPAPIATRRDQEVDFYRQKIREVLEQVNAANTDYSWHEALIKTNLPRQILMSSKAAACTALNELPPEDLAVFESDLMQVGATNLSACRNPLLDKINVYMNERSTALAVGLDKIREAKLSRCSNRQSEVLGPSETMMIETQNGGVLTGTHHPRCSVSLTFDDGPHSKHTPELLKILAAEKLLVNFFVVGQNVRANAELLKMQEESGHIIGNHTMTHADLRKLSFDKATSEIEDGFNSILHALGHYDPFFRFPYGASTRDLRSYLQHFGRVEFFWNIDTRDWAIRDPVKLFTYSLEQIQSEQRGIILYHDIQPQTIAMMPHLLQALRASGYTVYVMIPEPTTTKP